MASQRTRRDSNRVVSAPAANGITIVPLPPGDVKSFLALPWRVYAGDPNWCPPLFFERKQFLNAKKNPFFQHGQVQLFLARRGATVVGRIAAIINTAHDAYHHEQAGFFGLFECLPRDETAATMLFDAATAWVRDQGATFIRGPVNFSTNELACGLLVEGFDTPPVFDSAYNPPYYSDYIQSSGFTACKDLLAYMKHYDPPLPDRVVQAITRLRARRKITVRPLNMRQLKSDVLSITEIYNDAWGANWGFVPITEAEAHHMAKELRLAIIPELALIAEVDGDPIGCCVAIPDLNHALRHLHGHLTPWGLVRFFYHRRRINTARVAMMGVKRRYRRLGIDLLLLATLWEWAPPLGYVHGEMAWILEDNDMMTRSAEAIGAMPHKRYRLYQKDIA
jgi:GNAT superfamily N-acetyltransferase